MANQSFVDVTIYSSIITEDQIRQIFKDGFKIEDETIEHPYTYTEFEDVQFQSNKHLSIDSLNVVFTAGTCRWGLDDNYLTNFLSHISKIDENVVVSSTENEEQDQDIILRIQSLGSSQYYTFDINKEWIKQGANPDVDDAWEVYQEEMDKAKDAIHENCSKIVENFLANINSNLLRR